MSAAVVRWQIVTPHAESSANFYKKLFGWTVTQDNALGYRELKSGSDRGIRRRVARASGRAEFRAALRRSERC